MARPRRHSAPSPLTHWRRGLHLGLRPRVRAGRRLHGAGGDRRPGDQRRHRAGRGARLSRRGRGRRDLPRAVPERLLRRRPVPPGHAARGRRARRSPTGRRGEQGPAAGARRGCAAAQGQPRLQLRGGHPRAARVLGVAPKSYLPNYREFYEHRCFASGEDQRGGTIRVGRAGRAVRPDLVFRRDRRARAWRCSSRSARTCGCRSRRAPHAALAGATVLANLSGSPITVARAEDRRLLVRSASARCLAAYAYAAAGEGESSTDLSWDGQTMVYECGDLLGETERFPDGPRRTVVDVDLDRIRQERLRQGTFDDNRRAVGVGAAYVEMEFTPRPAVGRHRAAPQGRPVPVRARRRRAAGAGLLRGLQHPGLRARAAAARDRPAQGRHRRLRRARLDPRADRGGQGDGPARPAAQRHPRLHDAGVRHRRHHEVLRHAALQGPGRDLRGDRHPAGRQADARPTWATRSPTARRSTTSPSRTSRPGCAPTTCSGSPTSVGESCSAPATSPSWRSGWCTYGVGDQMSHYTVNSGVPKTLIQHLIRWVVDSEQLGPTGDEVNELLTEIVGQEITPELVPTREGEKAAVDRGDDRPLRAARLHALPRAALRLRDRARSPSWPSTPGPTPRRGSGRRTSRRTTGRRTTSARSAHWLEVFVRRFFASQFKRSALPNGPKVSAGGTMSPRGDWRMPSDAGPAAWLAELENVPRLR